MVLNISNLAVGFVILVALTGVTLVLAVRTGVAMARKRTSFRLVK